jgi:FkbM family methyltransferase
MARCEDVRTVFDVGANVGDWFILAAQFFPNARIHAFEILEDVCKRAAERASDPRITVHNLGLADHHGTIDILYNPSNSALSSAYHLDGRSGELTVQAPVTTGDRFMREHGLQRVDFLKLDVEGMEHKVLAGFQEAVDAGRIGAVQFEYGMVNIITRFLLRDFFNYFKERGYLLGKIYPGYVDFRDYKLKDEDFRGPNFLAVHESRTRLLEALQGHG